MPNSKELYFYWNQKKRLPIHSIQTALQSKRPTIKPKTIYLDDNRLNSIVASPNGPFIVYRLMTRLYGIRFMAAPNTGRLPAI